MLRTASVSDYSRVQLLGAVRFVARVSHVNIVLTAETEAVRLSAVLLFRKWLAAMWQHSNWHFKLIEKEKPDNVNIFCRCKVALKQVKQQLFHVIHSGADRGLFYGPHRSTIHVLLTNQSRARVWAKKWRRSTSHISSSLQQGRRDCIEQSSAQTLSQPQRATSNYRTQCTDPVTATENYKQLQNIANRLSQVC